MDKSDQYQYWISVYHSENLWKHVKHIHLYLWFRIGQSNDIQQFCHTPEDAPYISINQGELTVNHPRGTVWWNMVKRSPGIFRQWTIQIHPLRSSLIYYIYIIYIYICICIHSKGGNRSLSGEHETTGTFISLHPSYGTIFSCFSWPNPRVSSKQRISSLSWRTHRW